LLFKKITENRSNKIYNKLALYLETLGHPVAANPRPEVFMSKTVELIYQGTSYLLPLIEGTCGEEAVDISTLRSTTGLITYDPGFVSTGSCQSEITFLDGEQGILLYRGIPIEQLAEHSNFIETSFLLIYGHLPSREELDYFNYHVTHHSMIHESLKNLGNKAQMAVGTSFIVVFLIAVSSVAAHYRLGNIDLKTGLMIALGGVVGAQVGPLILESMSEQNFKRFFAGILVLLAIWLVVTSRSPV